MKANILYMLRDHAATDTANTFIILGPDGLTKLNVSAYDHDGWDHAATDTANTFIILGPDGLTKLNVSAYDHDGWDHVCVHVNHRCPAWEEMSYIKHIFFADDETAFQVHAPVQDRIDCHPYCLHLWRPQRGSIPIPPRDLVLSSRNNK